VRLPPITISSIGFANARFTAARNGTSPSDCGIDRCGSVHSAA
jgi:hypothetical protein